MNLLGLFAKYWQPGEVKTRLAARYGRDAAAAIHKELLATSLARFGGEEDRRVLAFSPADKMAEFAALAAPQWELEPQSDGDLGRRMEHFCRAAFDADLSKVVLLGADSPTLPVEHLRAAFVALDEAPAVIGPSRDGGYYLIGLRGVIPPIFGDMPWGSSHVLQETLIRLKTAGVPWGLLPEWYDIDTPEDVNTLHRELQDATEDLSLRPLKCIVADLMNQIQ